jgi:hypothetical protein
VISFGRRGRLQGILNKPHSTETDRPSFRLKSFCHVASFLGQYLWTKVGSFIWAELLPHKGLVTASMVSLMK